VSLWRGLVVAASFSVRIAFGHTQAWVALARWLVGGHA